MGFHCEVCEEVADMFGVELFQVPFLVKDPETPNPLYVRFFGSQAEVFEACYFANRLPGTLAGIRTFHISADKVLDRTSTSNTEIPAITPYDII